MQKEPTQFSLLQGDGKVSREQVRVGSPGGIFNIEFSGDGKVLTSIYLNLTEFT